MSQGHTINKNKKEKDENTMKRIIASILLLVVLATGMIGSLTSCIKPGGNQGGGNQAADFVMPEGGFDTTTPVTIKFYHSMGAALQEILNDTIVEFNKIYPNITVEHESLGDYDGVRNQIKTEIAVGAQPNLAYCYPDHIALYNKAGAVQTLDVLIADPTYGLSAEQIADFIEGYYKEGAVFGDGKMYSLPLSKSTEVLYYNVEALVKAGVVDADGNAAPPTTWEEMAIACEKLKATFGDSCIPLGYDSESNWFITMCEQYGSPYTSATGDHFLFDNETNRGFVKMFREWYEKKWVTTEELSGGYTSALFTGESSSGDAVSTRCYMCIGSTGGATYQQPNMTNGKYEFTVGIAPIPQVDPSNPKVISQGPSITIFKKSNPQEVLASWLFAKYLATDVTFQARVSMNNGYAPVIKSVTENEVYADFLAKASTENIQAYAVKVALEQEKAYYASPAFNGSSVAREQVGLLIQKCFTLEATPATLDALIKAAFEDAVNQCEYEAE